MDIALDLDRIEQLFDGNDQDAAMAALSQFFGRAREVAPDEALAAIASRLGRVKNLTTAAKLALAGGALAECGAPAGAIGRAIVAPVTRALIEGQRLIDACRDRHEEDGEIDVGGAKVSQAKLDELEAADRDAARAWASLETWYQPAAATWTRELSVLHEVQRDTKLRSALAAAGKSSSTSYWLSLLVETVFDAPFIVLFPETGEVWRAILDGVVDVGQLSVLLSDALVTPLRRIHASPPADPGVLDVMRGHGPQQDEGGYGCSFHLYPPEAVDPATGMPQDGRHTWSAPGGTGSHSLPPDFLPGTLPVRDLARILVVVGPKAPGMRFTRAIGNSRMFSGLPASVHHVQRLDDETAKRWFALVRS